MSDARVVLRGHMAAAEATAGLAATEVAGAPVVDTQVPTVTADQPLSAALELLVSAQVPWVTVLSPGAASVVGVVAVEEQVTPGAPVDGRTLEEARLPAGAVLVTPAEVTALRHGLTGT
ncbi:MAG: hypothetical protein ACYCXA_11540 [Actinomycetes bacterium]